jgi:signal transduction histidine kinase/DNA-binding response OmpR family regulator
MKRLSQVQLGHKRFRPPSVNPLLSLGYAAALEKIPEGVAIADPAGAVCYSNAAFSRIFSSPEDVLIGADLLALVADDDCAVVFPVHHPDETTAGFVAIIRDSREVRQLEAHQRQTQTMDAVGRLAAGVAHDFNNLLTLINGYAELAIISSEMSSPVFASLVEIRKAGELAAELAQRVLEVGRSQVLQPRVMDVNALVRDLIDAARPLLGGSITIASSLDPSAGHVHVDPAQFRRALLNLVMNAMAAMPDGGSLLIETARLSPDSVGPARTAGRCASEYVTVSLTDTGIGMDEVTRMHLFEPFYAASKPDKGNGMELSTAFGIIKQSGGHIQVYSAPGERTTFKVSFPRCEAETEAAAGSPLAVHHVPAPSDLRGSETVLVVEDDTSLRGLIMGSLGLLGYTVLAARNHEEAEAVCRQHGGTIDLLVTGALIAGVTARELVNNVRRMRPGIRVLYTSEHSRSAPARKNGATDLETECIFKPFSPHHLARKLRELLNRCASPIRPLVLIVDDEAPVRALLAEILMKAGYEVLQASDGEEVEEAVRERAPGIVITDLVMPRKEGIETIAEIRRLAPEAKIIAISGAFGGRLLNIATHLGANAALAKPIAADVLLRTVDDIWLREVPRQ